MTRAWAQNPTSLAGLYTEQSLRVKAYCPPPGKCCDDLPQAVNAIVWLSEPAPSGPDPPAEDTIFVCERLGLSLDPMQQPDGSYVYRGNLSDSNWGDYLNIPNPELMIFCNNEQQIPGDEDCTTAITGLLENLVIIRDSGCCCDPFCIAGNAKPFECPPTIPPGTLCILPGAPVTDPNQLTFGIWVYEIVGAVTSDTFNRADGDIDGTPTDFGLGGGALTWQYGGGGGNVTIVSNRIRSSNTIEARSIVPIGAPDLKMRGVGFPPNNDAQEVGFTLRYSDAINYWRAVMYRNRIELATVINGTENVVASQAHAFTQGTPHNLEVIASGNDVSFSVDGNTPIAHNNAHNATATLHGVLAQGDNVALDDFTVTDVDGGGVACEPTPRPGDPCPQEQAELIPCDERPDVEMALQPADEVRIVAKNVDIAVAGQPVELALQSADDVRIVAQTVEFSVQAPPSTDCCDGPSNTLTVDFYGEFASPGGSGSTECCTDIVGSATVVEEPPSQPNFRAWSGEFSFSKLLPNPFTCRVTCSGTGQNPNISVSIRNSTLPVNDTKCLPIPFAQTSDNTGVTLNDLDLQIAPGQFLSCGSGSAGPGDEAEVAVWAYARASGASADRPVNACTPSP